MGLFRKNNKEEQEEVEEEEESEEETYEFTFDCDNCGSEEYENIPTGTRAIDYYKSKRPTCGACGCQVFDQEARDFNSNSKNSE